MPDVTQARLVVLGGDDGLSGWVRAQLTGQGFRLLHFVTTPAEALTRARAVRADLVLALPVAGAPELRALSRADARRVVALADSAEAAERLADALGADDAFSPTGAAADFARRIRINAEIAVLRRHLMESGALTTTTVKRKMARLEKGLQLLKAAHAQIERQLEEARERSRTAMALPAGLIHELRTPLGAISGFAEVMKREIHGPLGADKYREYAEAIHQASGHLLDLVNDLMDIYKIEAGQLVVEHKPVDLRHVVRSVFGLLGLGAQQGNVQLSQALSPILPIIQTDESRLRQVLINLVGNAIKFTRAEGRVEVAAERAPGGNQVAIRVSDTGIGMSDEDIRAALSPFGQAKAGSDFGRGGTGLGLPISRMLVERLGGTFELFSQPGQGTTATIRLPA
jgi:signal transduction histidine kinase